MPIWSQNGWRLPNFQVYLSSHFDTFLRLHILDSKIRYIIHLPVKSSQSLASIKEIIVVSLEKRLPLSPLVDETPPPIWSSLERDPNPLVVVAGAVVTSASSPPPDDEHDADYGDGDAEKRQQQEVEEILTQGQERQRRQAGEEARRCQRLKPRRQ